MTFSNTLMLLGGEDFLRELTEFMLNCIMEADVTQHINAEPTSAAMSAKPTTTAIVTVSPRQLGTLWTCVFRSCLKGRTSRPSGGPQIV